MCANNPDHDHACHDGHKRPTPGAARSRNWQGTFPKTPGRIFGLVLIRAYQLTLSSLIGQSCRHAPTCSEYGYEAVARHGLWKGGFMALFRFLRCGPGGSAGFDPVPERLDDRFSWWAPWRLWSVSRPQ